MKVILVSSHSIIQEGTICHIIGDVHLDPLFFKMQCALPYLMKCGRSNSG